MIANPSAYAWSGVNFASIFGVLANDPNESGKKEPAAARDPSVSVVNGTQFRKGRVGKN